MCFNAVELQNPVSESCCCYWFSSVEVVSFKYVSVKNLFCEFNISSMSFTRAQVYEHHLRVHAVYCQQSETMLAYTEVLPVVI